jgi:2-succinyl-5-enolpyruvyl-6-hydroxy-3-cyclohexene-1-carboxylate synthase
VEETAMTTPPNRNVLWAEAFVEELAAGGLEAVCVSPGSRSTPLTMAFAAHEDVAVYSVLDERSAAFFTLGRARRTGEPTALVCTSGTAAANYHPAIVEASQARVPLLALTADRPPELRDSGANQTIDQTKLYGDAVRWYRELPEPKATPRKLRRVRTDAARALAEATGTPAGPVHVNCPFRKPLEPTPVDGDVPDDWHEGDERARRGRSGTERTPRDRDDAGSGTPRPYVSTTQGRPTSPSGDVERFGRLLADAETGLVVAGPADPEAVATDGYADDITRLAAALGWPVLADPLSDVRFGDHVSDAVVLGGYDGYVDELLATVDPDVVLKVGASPTSKPLRKGLAAHDARHVLVDPAGGWRDAEFVAADLIAADPGWFASALAAALDGHDPSEATRDALKRARALEETYWDAVADCRNDESVGPFEGEVVADAIANAPAPSTVFVSNSMPVRDADRFGTPRDADVTVLGNRGASGIDGVTSTALGAGSTLDAAEELVLVTGDLAFYHDMNGLLALERCGVEATIVLLNNDGGGIFHELPVSEFDPPFTDHFETPHGLDFLPTSDLYDLEYERVSTTEFAAAYRDALDDSGSHVIEVAFDGEANHDTRGTVERTCRERVRERAETLLDE